MALSDIAAGVEVTVEQRNRGVATVDDTGGDLRERLAERADALPCHPEAAATVVETHTAGRSVGESARAAGIAPVTAAKTLHLLGVTGVSPVGPTGREIVRDWLDGELSRSEATTLAGVDETTFSLAAFVESHEPIDALAAAVEGALSSRADAAVEKREELGETMSAVSDLL